MNFQTNSFEIVSQGNTPLFNTRQELIVMDNPGRFISPVNGSVVVQASYIASGPVFTYPWTIRTDYVAVTART